MISDAEAVRVVERLRAAGCVYAEDEAALLVEAARDHDHLEELLGRRVAGEPLEPLLGWVEFAGRRLHIAPGVFVPRRRTELLARMAAELAAGVGPAPVMIEMCCGAAPVAATVLAACPDATVLATDLDPVAVATARRNVGADRVAIGDLFAAVPSRLRGRVDVLAANAPYVPSAQIAFMPAEARLHEPVTALDGGDDGTRVQRRVIAGARPWLSDAGTLLIESGRRQSAVTAEVMQAYGFEVEVVHDDELEATVVVGR